MSSIAREDPPPPERARRVAVFISGIAIAAALSLSTPGLAATTSDGSGGTNDTLYKAINDFCIDARGTADEAAQRVLRAPYQSRDMDAGSGPLHDRLVKIHARSAPLYERRVGLLTLVAKPTLLIFRAASRGAPVVECRFNAVSQDIADMVARLRSAFDLPDPVNEEDSNDWHTIGHTLLQGRPIAVYLDYHREGNEKPGVFTLATVGVNVNELLLQSMRDYCVQSSDTVDAAATRAARAAAFGAIVADASEGAPYARNVRLGMPGSGETKMLLIGPSRSAPVSECRFTTSASDELTDMVARLRAEFALSEPTKDSDGFWQMTGRSSANGRSLNVEVTYKLRENRPASFLHVHVSR